MKLKFISLAFLLLVHFSCGTGFLDEKPNIKQRVPQTLEDYMGLLDNSGMMNGLTSHALGIIGSDEYFVTEAGFNSFPSGSNYDYLKRAYTWEPTIFTGGESYRLDWNGAYERILWTNVVLDGINKRNFSSSDQGKVNMVNGTALFHRAWNYYSLTQLFCPVYTNETASRSLGLPLRLEPDLTMKISRSSLKETYQQIIQDLQKAETLLPGMPEVVYQPSKVSVYALLARVYLQMGDYQQAFDYSDSCLQIRRELLDYNSLDLTKSLTFSAYGEGNPEVIFMATCPGNTSYLLLMTFHYMNPDTSLLNSYNHGDLRFPAYWAKQANDAYQYKGCYDGSNVLNFFTGFAVDEVYLIHAECAARLGDNVTALEDLNALKKNRFTPETFIPFMSNDSNQILDSIIIERRKELVLRGTRWEDLRRLNKEPHFQKTLVRKLGKVRKELLPEDPRYVWPLPSDVIQYGGYEQNVR